MKDTLKLDLIYEETKLEDKDFLGLFVVMVQQEFQEPKKKQMFD